MKTKSWRTTTFGLLCWVAAALIARDHIRHSFHELYQWYDVIALFVSGCGHIHARDHRSRDK